MDRRERWLYHCSITFLGLGPNVVSQEILAVHRLRACFCMGVCIVLLPWAQDAQAQPPKTITNSIGMKLVMIPKGTFQMGASADDEFAGTDEQLHQVTISQDYYLGVTEVTQKQFNRIMGTNPSYFQGEVIQESDCSNYPVEQVSWEESSEFCELLSEYPEERKAGRTYRLPTEAEWEYACRAGSKTAYCFGDSPKSLSDYAWFDRSSNGQTHPVGEKKPNAWGLYDMHGNVWEWCSDMYGAYPREAVTDPKGVDEGATHVNRGGGWCEESILCRSTTRRWSYSSYRGTSYGFRVALSSPGQQK